MKTQTSFYGWKLVAVLWLILFANMGFPMISGSVANAYMASDLHLSRTTVGLAFAIFTWVVGLLAPFVALHRQQERRPVYAAAREPVFAGGLHFHGPFCPYRCAA